MVWCVAVVCNSFASFCTIFVFVMHLVAGFCFLLLLSFNREIDEKEKKIEEKQKTHEPQRQKDTVSHWESVIQRLMYFAICVVVFPFLLLKCTLMQFVVHFNSVLLLLFFASLYHCPFSCSCFVFSLCLSLDSELAIERSFFTLLLNIFRFPLRLLWERFNLNKKSWWYVEMCTICKPRYYIYALW